MSTCLSADTTHFNREILRQCSLNEYITPNLTFDQQRTQTAKEEMLNNYSWANGLVVSGQKIIDRGEIISPETYNILESLRKESIKRSESIDQSRLDSWRTDFVCRYADALLYALSRPVPKRLL